MKQSSLVSFSYEIPLTHVPSVTLLTSDRPVIYPGPSAPELGRSSQTPDHRRHYKFTFPPAADMGFFSPVGLQEGPSTRSPHTQAYTEHLLLTGPARPTPREPEGRGHPLPAFPRLRARPGAYTGVGGREPKIFRFHP